MIQNDPEDLFNGADRYSIQASRKALTDAHAVNALGEMARKYDERAEQLICLQRNLASVLTSNRGAEVG